MKRFWSTSEYRKQQYIRRRKAERRPQKKHRSHQHGGREAFGGTPVALTAPQKLSVFDETEATVTFCNALQSQLRRRDARVYVDIRDVKRLSSDALLLMKAIFDEARGTARSVGGSMPTVPELAAKIKQSGFFTGFARPPRDLPKPQGMIRRKSDTRVESEIAGDLVQFAVHNAHVPRDIAEASYKTLVELMGNTHNHAARARRNEKRAHPQRWQASVYCEDGVAYFTFVDLGVGILRSAAPRRFLKVLHVPLSVYGEPRLLEDVFRGMIGASADLPGRGFGLQRMREAAQDRLLPELRVLTLSAAAHVCNMHFSKSRAFFPGTIFRWTTRNGAAES